MWRLENGLQSALWGDRGKSCNINSHFQEEERQNKSDLPVMTRTLTLLAVGIAVLWAFLFVRSFLYRTILQTFIWHEIRIIFGMFTTEKTLWGQVWVQHQAKIILKTSSIFFILVLCPLIQWMLLTSGLCL